MVEGVVRTMMATVEVKERAPIGAKCLKVAKVYLKLKVA